MLRTGWQMERAKLLPIFGDIPANLAVWGRALVVRKQLFFFRSTLPYREDEGQPPDRTQQEGLRRAFTPAVVLVITLPETKDNIDAGVIPLDLLPRRCPVCRDHTIIGHGRRLRQSHDDRHERIWVRRGFCRPCCPLHRCPTRLLLPRPTSPVCSIPSASRSMFWKCSAAPSPKDPIVVSSTASPIVSPKSLQKHENSGNAKMPAEIGQIIGDIGTLA